MRRNRRGLARGEQSPARGIVESEIKIGHGQAAIGIPRTAFPGVEQALSSLG